MIAAFTARDSARVRHDVQEVLELQTPFCVDTGYRRENLQFASVALDALDFPEAKSIFGCQNPSRSVDLRQIGREKTAVFLNISDTDRYADCLVNLFYTQALQVLCREADCASPSGRLRVPVRLILDDFAANAFIENFDKLISVIRSRNLSVSVILQNMTQLYSMYSEAQASTILNNCDHILYLGGQDLTTAQYIGARANKTDSNILLMPPDKAYLIEKGRCGELVDKIKPYAAKEAETELDRESG